MIMNEEQYKRTKEWAKRFMDHYWRATEATKDCPSKTLPNSIPQACLFQALELEKEMDKYIARRDLLGRIK